MTIKFKLTLLISSVLILLVSIIGFHSVKSMHNQLLQSARIKLKSDLNMSRSLIDNKYPGPWTVHNGVLYKGDTKMNDNFDVVDMIGELTGDTATIFMGDLRIATNVKSPEGKRAVKTKASEEVSRAVLQENSTYIGKAQVVGAWNQTAYEPIKDPQGKTIGMLYVGVPNNLYDLTVRKFCLKHINRRFCGIVRRHIALLFNPSLHICKTHEPVYCFHRQSCLR